MTITMTDKIKNLHLNANLKELWKSCCRYKFISGGRASGKTHEIATGFILLSIKYNLKFLCLRQFQNKISQSVFTVLKEKIYSGGLQNQFVINSSKTVDAITNIHTGSTFSFMGIARNIEDIKGTEGVDICWIEEAEGLTDSQWNIISPTIRKRNSEIWLVWNPRFINDYIQKLPRKMGDKSIHKHINYIDNPFLDSGFVENEIDTTKKNDIELYRHVYLGRPLNDDDNAIIKRSWIESAIDAHLQYSEKEDWEGASIMGFDVADSGNDTNTNVNMNGRICNFIDEWNAGEDELDKSAERTFMNMKKNNSLFVGYDSIGVGAGVGKDLMRFGMSKNRVFKFNAGESVYDPNAYFENTRSTNKEMFANLKAQSWWNVALKFKNTHNAITRGVKYDVNDLISLDSSSLDNKKLDNLIDELCTPRKDIYNGRVKVESKKDLKKRDIDSPNLADGFIIANSSNLLRKKSFSEWVK